MKTFFKKSKKTFLAFLPKLGQKLFNLEKEGIFLSVFKYSNYLPSCQKSEKTNEPLLRKSLNWRANRPTDGQANSGDFIEPSVGRGSNINQNISKTMDQLRRFQPVLPRSSLRTIYKTFIRSQLDYADVIYD